MYFSVIQSRHNSIARDDRDLPRWRRSATLWRDGMLDLSREFVSNWKCLFAACGNPGQVGRRNIPFKFHRDSYCRVLIAGSHLSIQPMYEAEV